MKPHSPIHFGCESDAALDRVAELGQGWYGFNLDPAGFEGRMRRLAELLRSYVVARTNPVRFTSKQDPKPPMELSAALTRMAAAARKFDVASVRKIDLALVAAVAGDPE